MIFRSGDTMLGVLLHHADVTMFEHCKIREQRCCHLGTQAVLAESLKHRVKICENVSIMVACDPAPQVNERSQSTGRYCIPHPRRTPYVFHNCNQAVNMKCFCWCLPDEYTSGGLE
ncbi:hypothetical protein TNCV_695171 [Trichonephila clavipes]|nr:hypothetical protein TNCV_695171 [Trichonephila clavipes]